MRRKTDLSPPPPTSPVIITDRLKAVLSLRFHLFIFGAVQFLNVLILTLLYVLLLNSVKVTELSPVWERAANSAYHLLFHCMLRYVCPGCLGQALGTASASFMKYLP